MAQWWDQSRINATVTRRFVEANLLPEERGRLDRVPGAGLGLCDDETYWTWISTRARRVFLILVDLNVTDQIFGVVDDSWSDDDLPVPLENIATLSLTSCRDEKMERRFFERQFQYVLHPLGQGEHHPYADPELVPVEVVHRPQSLNSRNQAVERVRLPNEPGRTFCRRRLRIGEGLGFITQTELLRFIDQISPFQNDHVVSYWASYVHQGFAYILFTPASGCHLKSFVTATPSTFKSLSKRTRRELVVNWILCLVDTLCALHMSNRSHGCVKPSSILLDHNNHIFFADSSRLSPESWMVHAEKTTFDREWYDYAAPEQWFRPPAGPTSPSSSSRPISAPPGTSFSIIGNAGKNPPSPSIMLQTPNPTLDPQPADIFSLGCVILELLTFLVKRQTRSFAAYRGQRRKSAGRGGAVVDTSFHKNLGQVEAWMSKIAKDASRKRSKSVAEGGKVFAGVTPMLHIVTMMLAVSPPARPTACEVQQRMYKVLTESCGIPEPHCVHQYAGLEPSLDPRGVAGPHTVAAHIRSMSGPNSGAAGPAALAPRPRPVFMPVLPGLAPDLVSMPVMSRTPTEQTRSTDSSGAASSVSSSIASSDQTTRESPLGPPPRENFWESPQEVSRERSLSFGFRSPRNTASR